MPARFAQSSHCDAHQYNKPMSYDTGLQSNRESVSQPMLDKFQRLSTLFVSLLQTAS